MIREERDPTFWQAICDHPEVKPHVTLGQHIEVAEIVAHPGVTPLASDHGGFLFVRLDGLGRVYELHTLFTPGGWGKEALIAAIAAFERMFAAGAQLITTYEVEGHWRSRPPKTFRFQPCGDFADAAPLPARLRTWALSRLDWSTAPARQRV